MANKLYEESHIQDIANAIRGKNGSNDTYTVAEMASVIENIQVGTTTENKLVYTGTITETFVGSGIYAVLAKDSKLAELRTNADLFVRVQFDIEPTPNTLKRTWAQNTFGTIPIVPSSQQLQFILRYDSSGNMGQQNSIYAIHDNTTFSSGTGRLYITEDGELRIYSNSGSAYAIRPSNYEVIVEW